MQFYTGTAVHYITHYIISEIPLLVFVPFDPVNSSSSVASTHKTGLEWPSATEMHCKGAVRPPFTPPMGLITPLKITHAESLP